MQPLAIMIILACIRNSRSFVLNFQGYNFQRRDAISKQTFAHSALPGGKLIFGVAGTD